MGESRFHKFQTWSAIKSQRRSTIEKMVISDKEVFK